MIWRNKKTKEGVNDTRLNKANNNNNKMAQCKTTCFITFQSHQLTSHQLHFISRSCHYTLWPTFWFNHQATNKKKKKIMGKNNHLSVKVDSYVMRKLGGGIPGVVLRCIRMTAWFVGFGRKIANKFPAFVRLDHKMGFFNCEVLWNLWWLLNKKNVPHNFWIKLFRSVLWNSF